MAVSSSNSKVPARRGDLYEPMCPSRLVLEHLTSRWGVLALIALLEGTHRFSELRRRIGGVSEKMLAQTLQALEKDGFVLRVPLPVIPPHVEYSLTPMGREVATHIEALTSWIERSMPRINRAREAVASKAATKKAARA
jgi:DNA-binding HxlR family transcriptional regulator